jgi:peptide/nickel transport system permease protein
MYTLTPGSATHLAERPAAAFDVAAEARRRSRFRIAFTPILSLSILTLLVVFAVFANQIAPFDPLTIHLSVRLEPPLLFGGTWQRPLGTDDLGRDILSRIIFGARTSVYIAATSLTLGAVFGTGVGIISGYVGGHLDSFLMRVADLAISYPVMLLALLLAVIVGPKTSNVILIVAFILWARFARIVRGDVLVVREQAYVALARIAGASSFRIMFRHILPNVMSTILVLASLNTGYVIVIEASLSFLGAGVPPPEPAWGSMTALGMNYFLTAWWVSSMPALAILLTVLAMNLFGDWVRDRLDPRLTTL